MLRALRALLLVCAVAAPAAAFGGEKVVRVDVDGRVSRLTTYASAAPDALRRAGHAPGSRDMVMPKGELRPGAKVTLRRAKPIELVVDGATRRVLVHGLTVGEALTELGMPPRTDDYVSPAPGERLRGGMRVDVRNAVHVTVRADGKTRDVVSSAPTVGDLLREAQVKVARLDRVWPPVSAVPTQDMRVRVVRVRERYEEKKVDIPHGTREERDSKLEKGVRRVSQKGVDGVKVRRYAVVLEDGKAVSRRLVSEKVARKPRDEVVKTGTGQPQFKGRGESQTGLASWFQAGGLTAAHRTLPMGTVVHVTNLATGKSVNVVIRDRGPYVEGRVIDLSSAAFQELAPLGAGTIRVKIEW